ncbi:MAG: hypothetical protein ACOC91_03710 [bacterium]
MTRPAADAKARLLRALAHAASAVLAEITDAIDDLIRGRVRAEVAAQLAERQHTTQGRQDDDAS